MKAFVLGVAISVLGAASAGAQATALSPPQIQAALEWGTSHEVSPYLLRHARQDGTDDVVVGAVYTPFLRVALASQRAWARGRRLTPDDLAPELLEPRLDLAIRWYVHGSCRSETPPRVVAVPKGTPLPTPRSAGTPPATIRPPEWLKTFGGELPYPDVALVVSYPLEYLRDDVDFLVRREGTTDDGTSCGDTETGRIPAVELKIWR